MDGSIVAYGKAAEKQECRFCTDCRIFCPVSSVHVLGNDILYRLGLHDAHMSVHQLSVLVEMDGGYGSDAVLLRDLRIFGGIELDDVQKGNFRRNVL